ncbi:MAG: hypothetical protein GXP37_14220 [Chloroflexi bacterium]|nr:hypothetical protein [Chloroflexota bacterium]
MLSKRKIIYALLVLAGGLILCGRQLYYAGKWRRVEDPQSGFALAYPATWYRIPIYQLPTGKYIDLFIMNFPVLDEIELRVYSDNKSANETEYYPSFGAWLIRHNNRRTYIIATHKGVTIGKGDYSGEEIIYENDTDEGRIITMNHNERVYAVEIIVIKRKWEEADAIFGKILDTFEFLE